jgi:hypothetical protein
VQRTDRAASLRRRQQDTRRIGSLI